MPDILHVFKEYKVSFLYVGILKKSFICVLGINKLTWIVHIYSNKLHFRSCTTAFVGTADGFWHSFQIVFFLSFAATFKIL